MRKVIFTCMGWRMKLIKYFDRALGNLLLNNKIGLVCGLAGIQSRYKLKKSLSVFSGRLLVDGVCPIDLGITGKELNALKVMLNEEQIRHPDLETNKIFNAHTVNDSFGSIIDGILLKISNKLNINHLRIESTLLWRNFYTSDPRVYSGDWHYDRRPENLFRVFILVDDVLNNDYGPFAYIPKGDENKSIGWIYNRKNLFTLHTQQSLDRLAVYYIGRAGEAMLVDTQRLLHRASVPKQGFSRDMLEIVFSI